MRSTMKRRLTAVAVFVALCAAAPWAAQQDQATPAVQRLDVTAGRSMVLTTDFDIKRLAITNPAVADATVVEPREVLIDGKAPGTVSLILWGDTTRVQYDVAVAPAITQLQQQLRELFPGEDINVTITDEATTLWGRVSSNAIMLRAGEIATKTSSKTKVINLLQVPGGIESQQVLLQVRFAEVNRNALKEAGINIFTGQSKDTIARSATEQFSSSPVFEKDGTLTFSDFLNLFVFSKKYDVGALLKALETKGDLQSLAEPNLIAYNGQEASFLAGGEIPVPVVTGTGGTAAISVTYKEFGISLDFTPTIAGDVIRLHVRPEVSALDFANGVSINGFRIPALTTRRAETEVELRDGQSFAIAGLMNNVSQNTREAIPLLGSLPILGNLFKSRSFNQQRTELMVLVTPHLVQALDPDEVPSLPTDSKQFLPPDASIGSGLQGGGGTVDGPAPAPPAQKP